MTHSSGTPYPCSRANATSAAVWLAIVLSSFYLRLCSRCGDFGRVRQITGGDEMIDLHAELRTMAEMLVKMVASGEMTIAEAHCALEAEMRIAACQMNYRKLN
jgi:hypothetical protein